MHGHYESPARSRKVLLGLSLVLALWALTAARAYGANLIVPEAKSAPPPTIPQVAPPPSSTNSSPTAPAPPPSSAGVSSGEESGDGFSADQAGTPNSPSPSNDVGHNAGPGRSAEEANGLLQNSLDLLRAGFKPEPNSGVRLSVIAQMDNPLAVAYEIAVILEELRPEQPPETPAAEHESTHAQENGDPSSSTEPGDGQENSDPSGGSSDAAGDGCGAKGTDGDPTLCLS